MSLLRCLYIFCPKFHVKEQVRNSEVVFNPFLLGENSIYIITPLLGMAKVLGAIGRSTKAVETYHRAISILELNKGAESEDLVVALLGLGNILLKEGRMTNAETHFVRLLSFIYVIFFHMGWSQLSLD